MGFNSGFKGLRLFMFILHKYFCIPMGVFSGYGAGLSGSINAGNFLTRCKVYWLASQEGLCSME